MAGAEVEDDRSAVRAATFRLSFTPDSVAEARQRLRVWLQRLGASEECAEGSLLVITELVTNALCHASSVDGSHLVVQFRLRNGSVHLAVSDGGSPERPHVVDGGLLATHGRGLALVEAVSEEWWWEPTATGRTVHALLALES